VQIPPRAERVLPAAVLWDMDGTVVDTEPYWMAAEREIVEAAGGTWTHEQALQLVGNPLLRSAEIILEQTPVVGTPEEVVDRIQGRVEAQMRAQVPWRPGAQALLGELSALAVPCALVTMSYAVLARVLVDALPRGSFAAVVTGDAVTHGKPHPEPYLTAADLLGLDPADCVAIEDSPTGVGSAVAAGVPTIGVPHIVPIPPREGLVLVESLHGVGAHDLWPLATASAGERRTRPSPRPA
jgi:HAD superfamily hydrolase (TIGR01509 family)